MLADFTAFMCVIFGYFFFWTIHDDFPPAGMNGPGVIWPGIAAVSLLLAWTFTLLARRWNRMDWAAGFYLGIAAAILLALGGAAALLAGPWFTRLDPSSHVYPATVWLLVIWTAFHVVIGVVMHAYCVARRMARRMTARYDCEIVNVAVYWHFVALTVVITVAVIAGFPLLVRG
jgi:cytochrome c oxidase subunit I+III